MSLQIRISNLIFIYIYLTYPMHAVSPTHLVFLYLLTITMLGEE
jgi:hypothetical protein